MAKEVMTVEQLAEYLQLNPQTIYRKAQAGEIPTVRIGKVLRFKKNVIDAWLRLASLSWGEKDRHELRYWAAKHAKGQGVTEASLLREIRKKRSKG